MTAIERKQNSEVLLATLNIHSEDNLPLLPEESEVKLKTPQEIAERILILTYLNCVALQQELKEEIINFLHQKNLWDKASPEEQRLFESSALTNEEEDYIRWRGESIWLLLWTINKVEKLELPVDMVSPQEVFMRLPGFMESTSDFITTATIRSKSNILDQSDFIFRLNWAMRQVNIHGLDKIALNEDIAYERYFAINWVTSDKAWEDV